jgi:hypothetical protein
VRRAGEAVPAEKEEAHEGRLEKKGHEAFDGQGRAKNVSDIVRVVGPVGPEFKFHGQPGGDPQGEVDAEELSPETGHVLVDLFSGHDIDGFHDDQDVGEAQSQRNKKKMVQGRHRELKAGEAHQLV